MEDVRGKLTYRCAGVVKTLDLDLTAPTENEDLVVTPAVTVVDPGERWTITVTPHASVKLLAAELNVHIAVPPTSRIFANGYQTWTESQELGTKDRIAPLNRLARSRCAPYGDYDYVTNPGFPGRFHGWTYGYVRTDDQHLTLFASLAERTGFTLVTVITGRGRVTLQKECGGVSPEGPYLLYDLYVGSGTDEETFGRYFDLLGVHPSSSAPLSAWTSWNNYAANITQENIRHNLDSLSRRDIPLDIFQIDDGWQRAVGDWLSPNDKFRGAMELLADEIRACGYKAGLWLAPFVAEEKSDLLRDHPDWFLAGEHGHALKAGYNPGWSGTFYCLDSENLSFRSYLREVFDTVLQTWHFDFVKLDFLYAACRRPRAGKTRGQVMADSMELLRDITGDKLTLGCGVPLGSAFGNVDFCRIGGDVSPRWEDRCLAAIHYRERVSTLSALHNAISRRQLSGRGFWNDPDSFILRDTGTSLTEAQRRTLFLVDQTMGSLVSTSDDVSLYADNQLRQYLSQFPLVSKEVVGTRAFGRAWRITLKAAGTTYIVAVNLGPTTTTVELEPGTYYSGGRLLEGSDLLRLSPYDCACLRLTGSGGVELLGTTSHLFPGMDVTRLESNGSSISLERSSLARLDGEAMIGVPEENRSWIVNDMEIVATREGTHSVLRVPLIQVVRSAD
ncbi:MAG: glycoside hydrolase family 36 protein [Candidatus Cryosericum sp.]